MGLFFSMSIDGKVMSSAYEVSCSGAGGCRMSHVYALKSVGERIPVLNWCCVDVCSLNVVYA